MNVQLLRNEVDGYEGIMPMYGTADSACFDIAVPQNIIFDKYQHRIVSLLVAFDIPYGFCLHIFPRSSTFTRHGLLGPTSIIDHDYTRDVHGFLFNMNNRRIVIEAGTRLFQGMLVATQEHDLTLVPTLRLTERGGLGSTGV